MQKEYLKLGLDPVAAGNYMLVVFHLVPGEGRDLLDAASEVAAESSTGSNLTIGTATEFSKSMDALVYKIDEAKNLVWIAYPLDIFDRGGNVQNILTYIVGNVFGMADVKAIKALDCWFPPEMLKNYDGPYTTIGDMKKYLGIDGDARPVLGTIIKPKIGLKTDEFADVCYRFWKGGGDFVKFDEPQADQVFCPFEDAVKAIAKKMEQVRKETGKNKVMSFNISAADFMTMQKRAEIVMKYMEKGSYAFLVDGLTAGWTAVQTARRMWPDVFLHFHRAGHGAMTREENPIGYTVEVLTKFGRLAGASGMHTGTAGIGKMAGDGDTDVRAAHLALDKVASGPFFEQDWGDMKPMCPIASGGLNPVLLKPFADVIGTVDFITTMGGGVHSHPSGTEKGAMALVQACEAWKQKIDMNEYAKTHAELGQAVEFYKEHVEYTKKYAGK